ncbi:MAG TPA: KTSC domain-containing protein [Solirubrobacteraceae bacterium]
MLPNDWQPCGSSAIEAYRYLRDDGVLQLVFVDGRMVYDYPCDDDMFERFIAASSMGRFVNQVLKPHAQRLGWSKQPYRWTAW